MSILLEALKKAASKEEEQNSSGSEAEAEQERQVSAELSNLNFKLQEDSSTVAGSTFGAELDDGLHASENASTSNVSGGEKDVSSIQQAERDTSPAPNRHDDIKLEADEEITMVPEGSEQDPFEKVEIHHDLDVVSHTADEGNNIKIKQSEDLLSTSLTQARETEELQDEVNAAIGHPAEAGGHGPGMGYEPIAVSSAVSKANIENLAAAPVSFYIRRAFLMLLIPLLFVLVIFYSAVQWYSQLNDDFHAKYSASSIAQVVRQYEKIAHEVSPQRVVSGEESTRPSQKPDIVQHGNTVEKVAKRAAEQIKTGQDHSTPTLRATVTVNKYKRPVDRVAVHSSTGVKAKETHRQFVLVESEASRVRYLLEKGKLNAAERRIEQVLKSGNKSPEILFLAGYLYHLKGSEARSRHYLEQALADDPYYRPAAELLAHSLVGEGGKNVSAVLMKLHERLPDSEVIASLLAQTLEQAGQLDSAIEVLRDTYRLNPTADLAYNIALLMAYQGKGREALQFINDAIRLSATSGASFREQDIAQLIDFINGEVR